MLAQCPPRVPGRNVLDASSTSRVRQRAGCLLHLACETACWMPPPPHAFHLTDLDDPIHHFEVAPKHFRVDLLRCCLCAFIHARVLGQVGQRDEFVQFVMHDHLRGPHVLRDVLCDLLVGDLVLLRIQDIHDLGHDLASPGRWFP